MDLDRENRAAEVFKGALALDDAERPSFINRECGDDSSLRRDVESLLVADREAKDFLEPVIPPSGGSDANRMIGTKIGRYCIRRLIAAGGMGAVFEAEQDHPQRTVALKLMRQGVASPSAMRRFEHESQILARLHHPGIAQVYDAGVYDDGSGGRPYFVMEYIPEARTITDFSRFQELSTHERLGLFASVCDAVHHGHQKGVIHRDLKPANILVEGRPASDDEASDSEHAAPVKVIDFGVARATDSDMAVTTLETDVGQLIGTLQYMSPEQVEADPHDLDVRTDVYSLGVVLYELLCGELPYDVSGVRIYEATRLIREQAPARLSTVDRALRGDLETIVLKALEKERERRYQSAAELATDIRRYLADQPILARPASATYHFRAFARRNKALVGGVTATFVVLVAGLIGVSAMYLRAAAAETNAELRAGELAQVVRFQAEQFRGVDLQALGLSIRDGLRGKLQDFGARRGLVEDQTEQIVADYDSLVAGADFTGVALNAISEHFVDPTLQAIEEQFADQPEVKASLLQTMASTLNDVGLLERAMAPQNEALEIRRREFGDEHADTLESIHDMGNLLLHAGRLDEAEPYVRQAMEMRREILGDEDPATLQSIQNMANLRYSQGRYDEAMPYAREALNKRRGVLGEEHRDSLESMNTLGMLLWVRGEPGEAEPYFREVLDKSRRILGPDDRMTLGALQNVGGVLRQQGKLQEAEPYHREALEECRRVLGDEHPFTLYAMNSYGGLYFYWGKYQEAEPYWRETLEKRRRVLGEQHPDTLTSINNLGTVLQHQGRLAEAEPYLREALNLSRQLLGEEHPNTLVSIANLGSLLNDQHKFEEAERYNLEALEEFRRVLGEEHPNTLTIIMNTGGLLLDRGRLAEAEPLLLEALEKNRRVLGEEHPSTIIALDQLGSLRRRQNKLDEAETYHRQALEKCLRVLGDEHPDTLIVIDNLGIVLRLQKRYIEAEALLIPAVETAETSLPPRHWVRENLARSTVEMYEAWDNAEPGQGYDVKAAEWRAKLEGEHANVESDSSP